MNVKAISEVSNGEEKHGLAWFLSLRAVWKLSVLELMIYLFIGIAAVIRYLINS